MSIANKTAYKFYKETGGGTDQADATLLAEAKQYAAADRDKGNNTLLKDKNLGAVMVNLQHMQDDEDNTRTFVQDEDEMINVTKGTFPLGCYYDASLSRWCIAITATEFMGGMEEIGKFGGATWGWFKNGYGSKDLMTASMIVEKLIPIGFKVHKVTVYGSNSGGSGNESQFKSYIGTVSAPTNTGAGASSNAAVDFGVDQSMDSGVNTDGDGVKTIRLSATFEDKDDRIYGGLIQLTQI